VFDEHGRHVAPVADWLMIVDHPARQTELRMVLRTAIDELPTDYRAVVVLRDVEGFSHQEIAESLGLTVVNVKMRVHRARLFLRKRLAARVASPFMWKKENGAFFRLVKCTTSRPPWQAATGGTRREKAYQQVGRSA